MDVVCAWRIHTEAVTQACCPRAREEAAGLWQGAARYKLKAWKYVRELKLDVREAEVRQTLTSKVTVRVKHKNILYKPW